MLDSRRESHERMKPGGQRAPTAHRDTFVRDRLPSPELWPDLPGLEALGYPERLNAAEVLLDSWVAKGSGDRVGIRFDGGHWTYRELMERANRIANVLVKQLELQPGNRVLLRGPNTPMMVACWFAVLKAGGVCVATMPLLRAREIGAIVDTAAISLALCDARVHADLVRARDEFGGLERIVLFQTEDTDGLEAMMSMASPTFDNVQTAADDPALVAFTSGTTGKPKGTVHFHRDILAVCDTYGRHVLRLTPNDLCCGSPPLAFTFGLGGLVLFPMRVGAA